MKAIILKDLRIYTNTRKYLIIQFVVLSILVLILFLSTMEFYAQGIDINKDSNPIDVGKQTYILFILCIFFTLFLVPRHAVDAMSIELNEKKTKINMSINNWQLLKLTPLGIWRILGGKLISVIVWSLWTVWITIPLFALSSYLGGIPVILYVKSGILILVSCLFFAMIGIGNALWFKPTNAKSICYGIVLTTTFLPLMPISPFIEIPMIEMLSPLASLLSILHPIKGHLWLWNVGLYSVLCLVLFPVLVWRISKI